MKTAMPSPRGTNHEGLYLSGGTTSGFAYDADILADNREADEIKTALIEKIKDADLSPESLVKIKEWLAKQDPAPLTGDRKPRIVQDAAERRAYEQRFPHANRLKY